MANFGAVLATASTTETPYAAARVTAITARAAKMKNLVVAHSKAQDFPIYAPTKSMSGTVYVPGGAAAVGATVKMFRQADDTLIATSVTDAGGHYMFVRDANDTYTYYVLAYLGNAPQSHGLSDRGSVPA